MSIWKWKKRTDDNPHAVGNRLDQVDWLGRPMVVGCRVVWPCDGPGSSKQMAVGDVTAVGADWCEIGVERRSRTGRPREGYDRKKVKLTAVGMAQVTVVG